MDFLKTPISYLKGVGPQRAATLNKELGVFSFYDLLFHFPFRYIDRSNYHLIKNIRRIDEPLQLKGKIVNIKEVGARRQKRLIALFEDESGQIELQWFRGVSWIKSSLKINTTYQVYGKGKLYGKSWSIPHPEISEWDDAKKQNNLQPVYSTTEKLNKAGLHSKGIEKLMSQFFSQWDDDLKETLPQNLLNQNNLVGIKKALTDIHFPKSKPDSIRARLRLKFEELFFLQLELLLRKEIGKKKSKGLVFSKIGDFFNSFYTNHIPFELTGAQKKVVKEIRKDFLSGQQMNRLLQGDVGSGKTLVAILNMLICIDNGYQATLIAPTEILANQHFETINELLEKLNISVFLLTGSSKKSDRKVINEQLLNGDANILIGTHAILEDTVVFKELGLVVIDEQHRFGVAQRAKMWAKGNPSPHILVMTATPIPRTLAMTFYGDLDVSIIDELPPGRKPISTIHRFESHRLKLFSFIREEVKRGRQVYIVYPLIQESEKLDFNNLMDGYESISRAFPLPMFKVSIVHGQMKADDKQMEMNRFIKGETNIMVATTVIEVGVNVPNASIMVIESAERFGLSQLHQLRGRVGRGSDKSYCILMTGNKLTKEAKLRMETMTNTNDGFELAEVDLKLRGAGDLMGTKQSGILDLKIADLSKDGQILMLARKSAVEILSSDPLLKNNKNLLLRNKMIEVLKNKPNWGKIS